MSLITDYGTLKETVRQFLFDRDDLGEQIEYFIDHGERSIYRRLRCPSNEATATWNAHVTPIDYITLPGDYLEAKLVTVDGRPIQRISDIDLTHRLAVKPGAGRVKSFARLNERMYFHPPPDAVYEVQMIYWGDFSGQFTSDTSTNPILAIAPDLYLYGALLQAEPYLGNDERVQIWQGMFEKGLTELNHQTDEAEYAGSVVEMLQPYGDGLTANDRRGWA